MLYIRISYIILISNNVEISSNHCPIRPNIYIYYHADKTEQTIKERNVYKQDFETREVYS